MIVMIDLRGTSANMENLLRIHSGPANRLKETVHKKAFQSKAATRKNRKYPNINLTLISFEKVTMK